MFKSRFHIANMDCPSEEQLIRGAMVPHAGIEAMEFDIPSRTLFVWHRGDVALLREKLESLKLGAVLKESAEVADDTETPEARDQTGVLRLLLAINGIMFAVELVAGLWAESAGLLSDSLDMLADAFVYGIALWAVGRAASFQQRAARLSGWTQLLLAAFLFAEVARNVLLGSEPVAPVMMMMASVALAANVTCLLALSRHRDGGVHMQASWIFSTNDVLANVGVILAGALVHWTSSAIPDLVIGGVIGVLVTGGAIRILKLSKA